MADLRIPDLPSATGVADADLFLKWDGTQVSGQRTQKVTGALMGAYVAGKVPNLALTVTATTTAPGTQATATLSGTYPTQTLALGIPKGLDGTGTVSTSGLPVAGNIPVFTAAAIIGPGDPTTLRGTLNAAVKGANNDITSLSGLTTPLSAAQGGTGATAATGTGSVVLAASPALTGTPTVPTATAGTNTTQAASTAFVQVALPTSASAGDVQTGTNSTKFVTSAALATSQAFQTLTDGATIAWNGQSGFNAKVTLGGNRTLAAMTNPVEGQAYALRVIQDGTGSRTLTFNAAYDFGGAGAPTLSTTATKDDMVYLLCVDASAPKFKASFSKGT